MHRNTYAQINLKNIELNVKKIINTYNNYRYYFGVVKADAYGHGIKSIQSIIDGGCNYLAVATLDEAILIRKRYTTIPILCLGPVPIPYIKRCFQNNITITINSFDYALNIVNCNYKVKVHIKINSGMNRLGIKTKEELLKTYNILINNNIFIEGIYTHMYNALSKKDTLKQIASFEDITTLIDINKIPIVHMGASEFTINYDKPKYVNGCRLGIIMYGLVNSTKIDLLSSFSLYSEIIQINRLNTHDVVGYNGSFKATKETLIGVVPIGYADGIIRANTGRYVYINDKKYPIVGNICMDMLFIKIDSSVKLKDKVTLIKDNNHIFEISTYLNTICYEVLCLIGKRIPRKYIK